MTLSLNCKEAGDPGSHTMYGETEEELLANAKNMEWRYMDTPKKHGMKSYILE
jgi:hypothetical protein